MSIISTTWDKVKHWSGWSTAGSILEARVTALVGFAIGVVGVLDVSPLLSMGIDTGINWVQATWIGGMVFVKGVFSEITRRANDPLLSLKNAKEDIKVETVNKKKAKKQIKKVLTEPK